MSVFHDYSSFALQLGVRCLLLYGVVMRLWQGYPTLFSAVHSDASNLANCRKGFLKHLSQHGMVFILFIFALPYDELCRFFKK